MRETGLPAWRDASYQAGKHRHVRSRRVGFIVIADARTCGSAAKTENEMSATDATMRVYLTGLRNQHAVETQAIGTIKNELSRMEPYPELHARMSEERERSTEQAARLDRLLGKRDTSASVAKEAVAGTVATVAGFVHATASDEVLKNVLAAVGFKAYEIGSYKVLITLAEAAGAAEDVAVLEQSVKEEMEMGDWLGSHLPQFVHAFLAKQTA